MLKELKALLVGIPFLYGLYNMVIDSSGWVLVIISVVYLVAAAFFIGWVITDLIDN